MKNTDHLPIEEQTPETFFREIQVEFLIHEMKDPLSVVETGLRTLLERREKYGDLSARQEKTLKRSLRNTRKAREMLYSLLEVGRSQAGCVNPSPFRLGPAVIDVIAECMETAPTGGGDPPDLDRDPKRAVAVLADFGIALDMTDAADLELRQDEIKFRQILSNLIRNALHHRRKRLDVAFSRKGDTLQVDIVDDGPGIAARHHDMIFERYARVAASDCDLPDRRGHGLGLAGARIMARTLNGDIAIQSEAGRGATFRLTLPLKLNPTDTSDPNLATRSAL